MRLILALAAVHRAGLAGARGGVEEGGSLAGREAFAVEEDVAGVAVAAVGRSAVRTAEGTPSQAAVPVLVQRRDGAGRQTHRLQLHSQHLRTVEDSTHYLLELRKDEGCRNLAAGIVQQINRPYPHQAVPPHLRRTPPHI
jgi:hypothetical protein